MKLNFWQWMGLILLVVGVACMVFLKKENKPQPQTPAESQPASLMDGTAGSAALT